jgi:glycosyltransferase involved in cell wall biosynthesis
MQAPLEYVLITPARNEAQFIELTIKSVIAQTLRPMKWIIVSDGSTDGTDEIVRKYVDSNPWIKLIRMPERNERHFAGKVYAFNAGYALVGGSTFEVVGNLDADVSFDDDYFSYLIGKVAEDAALGVVGTAFRAQDASSQTYDYRFVGTEHVSGACQLFRRVCFEEIGGYLPVKGGGVDHIAVLTARMKGWKTRTFTEKVFVHHRGIGTAQHGELKARFKQGMKDYALGSHPIWELSRTAYQLTQRPFVIGGCLLLSGYMWALIRRAERPVSHQLMKFRRREQMTRLRKLLSKSTIVSSHTLAGHRK